MTELKEITFETPSSSGESEKRSGQCQRKKKKLTKLGSANSCSQIPRANSVQRIQSSKEPSSVGKFKEPSKSVVPYRIVKKSFSQMDMKLSRNYNGRFQRTIFQESYGQIALPKPISTNNKDIYYSSKDSLYYMDAEPNCGEISSKLAGMKIFATIMLNSWRKRRDDVRRLNEELEQLQKRSIKVKNQVHVLSSVFRNEQKQNDKLNRMLRHASDDIQRLQSSVESLTTSLICAKADSSLYEQQFHAKEQENESLNNILVETNSQLFKSMAQARHLQTSLSSEQRSVQQLENQKNELLNEISLTEMKWKSEEEKYLLKLYQKDENLAKANSEIKILETLLMDLKEKEFQVRDLRKSDLQLKNEIETLKSETRILKTELSKCLSARIKRLLKSYMELNRNTILLIHLGAFYLLPAIPPPKSLEMPFTVSLDKVISIIRN